MNQPDPDHAPPAPGPMSRTAVLAAMFAVPLCCPPMSLLACITGAVALWQMRADAGIRGRWLAWTAIAAGAVSALVMSVLLWQSGLGVVLRGPEPPLQALTSADPVRIREQWTGTVALMDRAALQAFAKAVHDRYGNLRSAESSTRRPLPLKPPAGKAVVSIPATVHFEQATLEADLGLELFDERSGQGVMRWRSLRLMDPERGDLILPPGEPPPPPASPDPAPHPAARPVPPAAPSPPAPSALR